ncbi:MAG TPA: DUF1707 domain-containing protein [Longimicrobium sp.]|nr:DUF1707 domain-containing protein [Longimicrobium sp.]
MAEPAFGRPVPLEQTRERVINQLIQHYAAENLTDAGLEERLMQVYAANTVPELHALVADLPVAGPETAPAPGVAPAAAAPTSVARADYTSERQVVAAVMGGAERKGVWTPPKQLFVVAAMGGAELDFRQARFGPGVTEVMCFVLMGGVEIVVPPGVYVDLNGLALMGGFGQVGHAPPPDDPAAPVLKIGGVALMGGVDVSIRYPGERASDAKRRERLEHKERKRLGGG